MKAKKQRVVSGKKRDQDVRGITAKQIGREFGLGKVETAKILSGLEDARLIKKA